MQPLKASAIAFVCACAALPAWPDKARDEGVHLARPDPVICKRIRVTGSHFRRKICQRQSAWKQMQRDAQDTARDIEQRAGAAAASNSPG